MDIMDRQDYINKANHLLNQNTYRSIAKDPTSSIKNKLINISKSVKNQTGLDSNTYKSIYLTGCVPPKFFGLPKNHKPDAPSKAYSVKLLVCYLWCGQGACQNPQIIGWQVPTPHHHHPKTLWNKPGRSNWNLENVSVPMMCLPCSPQSQLILPSTSSRIYWIRTPPSRKEQLWKLETLSSYWSFVSRTPTFLSKTSSMNRLSVQPWVPQSAPLWPIYTWST